MVLYRPSSLEEFIGQTRIKEELKIYIPSVKSRQEVFPHTFFIGAPGLGKTTLARIIAFELRRDLKITSGPVLDKTGTLAAVLTNLKEGDILFIDEIHRMPKVCQEVLYAAMEDFALDIVIGKGQVAKTIRLSLPKFTLIAATNKPNLCLAPLRDRFQLIFKLNFYTDEELKEIIIKVGKAYGLYIDEKPALSLAKASKGIPRQAINLLRRLKDFAWLTRSQSEEPIKVDEGLVKEFLELLDIDEWGLTPEDRKCLLTLYKEFKGGPVGLGSLALSSGISVEELESIYEPALIRLGMLARTRKGRVLTQKGYLYLKERFGINPLEEGLCLFSK
ncbi:MULTISPECIES: Holliday junction branch migration DNA helicase RuvB [Thermodesulfobacterium]|jgi:Holliday junction DNA helicase RuvB|uniref:Holliday junction branch migration complex subunit RuvB n=1 Tax=Thermodesulfobacterium commune TaxID=1741 RepID=A0A117LCC7_9BACT|nr:MULTISPECIES: Holliday junction branch migration DNA helicase RuvB [Thermodesulfobacterium]KUJ97869.1 MAG: Holliday junction ATP-dependent DNA helicase RuvB [Thermodesulfobacterium sp. 37_54]KUK19611.1 MAG: Holliday junction ATP-dependent DNA helicase RuvB [Thermodesulfobacterium commune]KUK38168.1 MAG: Holliday junction ATP-dependent DNA helicase RuvB [Thermodesulfobacterium commune]MBZ4681534.1 ruvB [Thermodesulfobacterium sp.]MDK2861825.1 holliday junction helicase RuvB [Thermodesulfobac